MGGSSRSWVLLLRMGDELAVSSTLGRGCCGRHPSDDVDDADEPGQRRKMARKIARIRKTTSVRTTTLPTVPPTVLPQGIAMASVGRRPARRRPARRAPTGRAGTAAWTAAAWPGSCSWEQCAATPASWPRPARRVSWHADGEPERAPGAQLAGDADLAAHQPGQPPADRQPEAGAAVLAGDGGVGLGERLEDQRELVGGDPHPGVGDLEPDDGVAAGGRAPRSPGSRSRRSG